MNFSFALIAKNEAKTLPRLIASLSEFHKRGGKIFLLDTGSTDGTAQVARDLGCQVTEVGDRFSINIDEDLANRINERFVADEEDIVKAGDKQFDYSSARNYIAELADTDFIFTPDCDESYTKLDVDKISKLIEEGIEQLEYNFVFSHKPDGSPAIKFMHCKAYDKTKLFWKGTIHEILQGEAKRQFVGEDVIYLEHWQNHEQNREHYLRGLAIDCFRDAGNDRNSHYFGRELLWRNMPQSAITELQRHIAMNKWPQERSQSMVYIARAYGMLNEPEKQVAWLASAIYTDGIRREPFIDLARFYQHNGNHQLAVCYAKASMEIPYNNFYANDMKHYTTEPLEILYQSYGWLGKINEAKDCLDECLKL